jgi:hypothetical protein
VAEEAPGVPPEDTQLMNMRQGLEPTSDPCERAVMPPCGGTLAPRLCHDLGRVSPFNTGVRRPIVPVVRGDLADGVFASGDAECPLSGIQQQHRRIFALIREYQVRAVQDADGRAALALLDRIVDSAGLNFSSEESMLEVLASASLAGQQATHRAVLGGLRCAADEWRATGVAGCVDPEHMVDVLIIYYVVDDLFIAI